MITAREAAFEAVRAFTKQKQFIESTLKTLLDELGKADRSLAVNIAYGTLENLYLIDHNISLYSSKPVNKIDKDVLSILRISAYQLYFLSKVPDYSICNEAVELAKKYAGIPAAGFVNAVMRNMIANGKTPKFSCTGDKVLDFTVNFSLSESLSRHFLSMMGVDEAKKMMHAFSGSRDLTVVANLHLISAERLCGLFSQNGIECRIELPSLIKISNPSAVQELPGFSEGFFHVQDTASYLSALLLDVKPGMNVIDVCAAPGGKTFSAASLADKSCNFRAFDINDKKVSLIRHGIERLKYNNIKAEVSNAAVYDAGLLGADRIICDVPCSGYGTLGKNPEVRFKDTKDAQRLPQIQSAILNNVSKYLVPGGVLVYSTCTLSKAENEDVILSFLENNKGFYLDDYRQYLPERYHKSGNTLTLFPHTDDTDGFFMARIIKKQD